MCIERNRDLLFWTAHGLQIVLPNPTTPALTREAGLVHGRLTPVWRSLEVGSADWASERSAPKRLREIALRESVTFACYRRIPPPQL
jgi:hypothetical protein